jgi:hypothetical protein
LRRIAVDLLPPPARAVATAQPMQALDCDPERLENRQLVLVLTPVHGMNSARP